MRVDDLDAVGASMKGNDIENALAEMRRLFDKVREDADRVGRDNDGLCDDLHTAGVRIHALEHALAFFADHTMLDAFSRRVARAVLLGRCVDEDGEDGIDEAWSARQRGRAA